MKKTTPTLDIRFEHFFASLPDNLPLDSALRPALGKLFVFCGQKMSEKNARQVVQALKDLKAKENQLSDLEKMIGDEIGHIILNNAPKAFSIVKAGEPQEHMHAKDRIAEEATKLAA